METDHDLSHRLSIFVRDEIMWWHAVNKKEIPEPGKLREIVMGNIDEVVRRATVLSCKMERERTPVGAGNIPANQTVIDLLSKAMNPRHLAQMEPMWMPWM